MKFAGQVNDLVVSSVRIAKTEGSQTMAWALYEVSDGHDSLFFFGSLPLAKWRTLATLEPPTGVLIAGSSQKLYDWAQRFTSPQESTSEVNR